MPNNNHIVNFLDNYLEVQHDPDYAVLITGCWGSGKTHFIKQYLGGKDWKTIDNWLTGCEKYRVVYVSLFGAKSREELNQRVIERVAPYLKKLSVLPQAVSLIGSFLHPTAGLIGSFFTKQFVDLLNNNKQKLKKVVVVFDDVERTDLKATELLGYINEYVECLKVPCIMIADKDHWENSQADDEKKTLQNITTTKEKIVGKVFQIQTSFGDVWNSWTEPELCPIGNDCWTLLDSYKDEINQVIEKSGQRNFRSLKHTMLDFQRFMGLIEPNLLLKREFNSLLITDFFVYQYSNHLGIIKSEEIGVSNATQRLFAEIGQKKKREELLKEYPETPFEKFEALFENLERISEVDDSEYGKRWLEIWKVWLDRNIVDSSSVNTLIKDSIWFDRESEYYLRKMYGWFMEDDDVGRKAMDAFEYALNSKTLLKPISIMTLCNKVYMYAKLGVFKENYEEFCSKMEDYVRFAADKLVYEEVSDWKKHLIHDTIDPEIEDALNRLQSLLERLLQEKRDVYKLSTIEDFWRMLLSDSRQEFERACHIISFFDADASKMPFAELDVGRFCDAFQKVKANRTHDLYTAIEQRYERKKELIEQERPFLERLLACGENIFKEAERPLLPSVFSLYYMNRAVRKVLEKTR